MSEENKIGLLDTRTGNRNDIILSLMNVQESLWA